MLVVVIQGDVLTTTNIIALNNGLHSNKYICLDWRILNFNQMYLFECRPLFNAIIFAVVRISTCITTTRILNILMNFYKN